ncbi:uncharacterized protein TNCV_744331 [Trichonephila clavipes]|nr:uncharacterized protein TNCV_744331 [Trichonephila clavipes]
MHMKCPPGKDSWCFYRRALAKGEKPAPHKFNIGTPINPDYLTKIVPIYQRLASDSLLKGCARSVSEAVSEYNFGTLKALKEIQKAANLDLGEEAVKIAATRDYRRKKKRNRQNLIISSEDYDEELTKNIHSTIVEDRKAREENLRIEEQKEKLRIEEGEEKLRFEQLRLDEQKRKYEFELEKLRIQTQSKLGADTSKESDTKFLVKEISKFTHRFDLKEDISLYLKLFEPREPDDKANSYEHVKDLLLKRFKLTPEKFRQLFVTHQKAPERTWIDFYHELNTYFNGWIDGLKIDTFNKLSDLIITDQLKRKTPFEFKEYYLDEWANMNSPVQLAEKLEEFEDFKRTLKQKSSSSFVKKQEFRFTEKNRRYEAPGKFEYNRKDKKFPASTNYNKHYEAPVTKYESVKRYQDSAQKGYYNKNYEKHSNHNASKLMLRRTIQNRRNSKNLQSQKKLAHSSLRKVYVLNRDIFWKGENHGARRQW